MSWKLKTSRLFLSSAVCLLSLLAFSSASVSAWSYDTPTPDCNTNLNASDWLDKMDLATPVGFDFADSTTRGVIGKLSGSSQRPEVLLLQPGMTLTATYSAVSQSTSYAIGNTSGSSKTYYILWPNPDGTWILSGANAMASGATPVTRTFQCTDAQRNVIYGATNTASESPTIRNKWPYYSGSATWAGALYEDAPPTAPFTGTVDVTVEGGGGGISMEQFKEVLHDYGTKGIALAITGVITLLTIKQFVWRGDA